MRGRLLWLRIAALFLLGLTWSASRTAFAQNPNTPVENRDYFVSDTGDDDTTVLVRIARGINLNTEAFATRLRVTPFDIRRENPRATLALCKNAKGLFQMSKETVSVATRESETIWKDCPADRRYTYIVPGSTLLITIGKHRATYEQEQQSLEALKACPQVATASCMSKALEPLGKSFDAVSASSIVPPPSQVAVQKPTPVATASKPEPPAQPTTGSEERSHSEVPFIGLFLIAMFAFLVASALWRVSADKASRLRATLNAAKEQAATREAELEELLEKNIASSKEEATKAATKHAADMNEMQLKFNAELRGKENTLKEVRAGYKSTLDQLEVRLGIEKQEALSALTAELRRQFDGEKAEALAEIRQRVALSEPLFIELRKEADASHARVAELEKQAALLIHESGQLEDQIRELRMLLSAAQEEYAQHQRAIEERKALQQQYDELCVQTKEIPVELEAYSLRRIELEAQIDALGEDVTNLTPLQHELDSLIAKIPAELETPSRRRVELMTQIKALGEDVSRLAPLQDELDDLLAMTPVELEANLARQVELEGEIQALREDVKRLVLLQNELDGLLMEIQDKNELLNGARTQAAGVLERLRQSYIDTTGVSHFPPSILA